MDGLKVKMTLIVQKVENTVNNAGPEPITTSRVTLVSADPNVDPALESPMVLTTTGKPGSPAVPATPPRPGVPGVPAKPAVPPSLGDWFSAHLNEKVSLSLEPAPKVERPEKPEAGPKTPTPGKP